MWWDSDPGQLSAAALNDLDAANNDLYLSVATVWEMQIKHQLGKLPLTKPLDEIIEDHCRLNNLQLAPLQLADITGLSDLPPYHRDPFDRIIISQARRGGYRLVTCDSHIARYEVAILW